MKKVLMDFIKTSYYFAILTYNNMSLDFYKHHWKSALLFGAAYLGLTCASEALILHPATLFPASALAIAVLFLMGFELWPIVFLATALGEFFGNASIAAIIIMPVAYSLQAVIGAWCMRSVKIDPLFRKSRDTFLVIGIILLISAIGPSFGSLAAIISTQLLNTPMQPAAWSLRYIGTVLCLLVFTPFFLRWLSKPRFSRTPAEIIETIAVFVLLVGIDVLLFIGKVTELAGVPLEYFLLVPIFWIALRLRPRFLTLALVLTTLFAVASLYAGGVVPLPSEFSLKLLQIEELLITLSIIFLIVVSLEEDRRLSSNLLKSQVATLENAVVRISSESSAKNDFIAVLGHELRNPLAPVVSSIDLLRAKQDREPAEIEMLNMMDDRLQTVRRLLDDLLDISRITEGKVILKSELVELETVIKHAILTTAHHFKERHQLLTFRPTDSSLWIYGDPVRLEQIFSNLLTNASKYSNSGDQINISLKKAGTNAEIAITDPGIGIDESVLEKIFIPFHQVGSGAQSKKGLGIGLALVRSFVEMHRGTVTAASKGIGAGSKFTVTFPLSTDHGHTIQKPQKHTHEPVSTAATTNFGPRVLVVDDNDAAAWSMGKLLELKGCVVSYAYDGAQAIEQAMTINPEIVLMDIGLPDQDGYAVAKTMRARGYHGRLIALTGYSTEDARKKGSAAGFEHYVIKPAGFNDLKRVIPEIA
jgi:signal transduction histidine kinase/CheY-like chemotaxis protein